MSDLVGNPEDRFSHVAAHIFAEVLYKIFTWEYRGNNQDLQSVSALAEGYVYFILLEVIFRLEVI